MDINEVPQDSLEYKDRDKLKKLVYAVGKDGKYTGVGSSGWEPENVATKQAWDAIEEELAETWSQEPNCMVYAKEAHGYSPSCKICGQMAVAGEKAYETRCI